MITLEWVELLMGAALVFAVGGLFGAAIERFWEERDTNETMDQVEVRFGYTVKDGEDPHLVIKQAGESWDEFKRRMQQEIDKDEFPKS